MLSLGWLLVMLLKTVTVAVAFAAQKQNKIKTEKKNLTKTRILSLIFGLHE